MSNNKDNPLIGASEWKKRYNNAIIRDEEFRTSIIRQLNMKG
jgi:hypothetical protein